jgi:cyclic pyranopterin phosphate synthase
MDEMDLGGGGRSLTHIDGDGMPRMVDVGAKDDTRRTATAVGTVTMRRETLRLIMEGGSKKGDVLSTARIAGVMAAKNTPAVIPMCHNILITGVDVDFEMDEAGPSVRVTASVSSTGKTGVEMEALHAVAVAALTIYDMCKSADRGMAITGIALTRKEGGKSGLYANPEAGG